MLEARNFRPVMRPGAGRDQDGLGAHALAVRQAHGMGIVQHGAALDQSHIEAVERCGIGRFQPGDFAMDVADQHRPMERRLRHAPAETGRVLEFVGET